MVSALASVAAAAGWAATNGDAVLLEGVGSIGISMDCATLTGRCAIAYQWPLNIAANNRTANQKRFLTQISRCIKTPSLPTPDSIDSNFVNSRPAFRFDGAACDHSVDLSRARAPTYLE